MLDQTTDPDYYYHVAISRHILENGVPHTLPQVKGTGWDILFSDKEFLFHQLTTLFYWIFGEIGLRILPVVITAGTFVVFGIRAFQRLPLRYAFVPFLIFISEPYFLRRILMVRPQVLAVFFFTLLLYSFLTRRKYLVAISAALYTLSYHALQIPLLVLAAGLFASSSGDEARKKCLWALGIGLLVGVLVNPYFPGNVMIVPQIIDIVLGSHTGDLPYGAEIYPWKANYVLNYSLITFLLCGFSLYCLGNAKAKNDKEGLAADHKMLLVLSGLFFAVSCMTPRGREYLVPCLFFLAVFAIENRARFLIVLKPFKIPLIAALAVTVAVQWALVNNDFGFIFRKPSPPPVIEALNQIPADATGHVLNCNWSDSPFIFYARPKLTFLDIMDPSFLFREAKTLHIARKDFNENKFADPYFSAKYIFKAKYVLCQEEKLEERLDMDPRFKRLFPLEPVKGNKTAFGLFELKGEESQGIFANEFQYKIGLNSQAPWISIQPALQHSGDANLKQRIDYFDFNRLLDRNLLVEKSKVDVVEADGKKVSTGNINCVQVKPTPAEIKKHLGSEILGLGGGPNLRAWLNGKPLFESYGEPATASMIQTLVPLPKPLTAQDSVSVLVCPGTKTNFYGIAMSFFTQKTLDAICEEKGSIDSLSRRGQLDWPYKGDSVKTCLGNLAAKR